MKGCECEHESHFGTDNDVDGGGPSTGHLYGSEIAADLVETKTIYGTYMICAGCRQDHPIPDSMLDLEGKGKDA